ncbi:uncharacterized protein LOC135088343 [Ostrinia nubilalis]|uniref:uncharacterized protein LOC135088343 n=1 Tax=Ostrinia nubilalis TaxID=29057 RepID=UPI003082606B
MLASLSDSTLKQYNVCYKLWWHFCESNKLDTYEPTKSHILGFLTEQFNKGCSHASLNSHRSALSLLLGNSIGNDECVKRLLKGAFKLRPSLPKYTYTWDPQLVLNHLSKLYPNTELTLENITKKLAALLAICTAQRVQTISLIKLSNITINDDIIRIIITDIIKTSRPGHEQPILNLPYFHENIKICPATTLKDYILLTRHIREDNSGKLLLTFKPPHRPATTQTISRWVKQVLADSGIDISIFTAHSTRHAATSAASRAGSNIETIRKAAGWSNTSSTFARFYHRNIQDDGLFAKSVCLPT